MKLLSEGNAKTPKGEKYGWLTAICYLSPADSIPGINLCPYASKGCKDACLYTAGRGKFSNVKSARENRTILFRDNPLAFLTQLEKEINKYIKRAKRKNMKLAIRLNGTSDIKWEEVENLQGKTIFDIFPEIQFYDYTKRPDRDYKNLPKNYHLTFSFSGKNWHLYEKVKPYVNVAVVFDKLPKKWKDLTVIDGDETDLRFLDKKNCIVGLKAKGEAKKDTSGFVINLGA